MKKLLITLFIATLLILAPRAGAHAFVVQCEPGVGGRVETAPTELRCSFTQPIVARTLLVVVTNQKFQRVDLGDAHVDDQDPTRLIVSLDGAKMTSGYYRVQYGVVSTVDLDMTQDAFYFGIGVTVPPTPTPALATLPPLATSTNPLTSNPIIPGVIGAAAVVLLGALVMFIRAWREKE